MAMTSNAVSLAPLLARAFQYHQRGEFDQALTEYQRVIDADRSNGTAWFYAGLVALQSGDFAGAIHYLEGALPLSAQPAHAHVLLGRAQLELARLDKAVASFRHAIRLAPEFVEAYVHLGRALCRQGHMEAALDAFRRALSVSPDSPQVRCELACLYEQQGHWELAAGEYAQALKSYPALPDLHHRLARVLQLQGKCIEAVGRLHYALQLDSHHFEAHLSLGKLMEADGQLERAQASFERALAAARKGAVANLTDVPVTPVRALVHLGAVLIEQGRNGDALAHLEQAMTQDADGLAAGSVLLHALQCTEHRRETLSEQWARRHAHVQTHTVLPLQSKPPDPASGERLRIGYLIPELCATGLAPHIEPVLANHDREGFQIFCYYTHLRRTGQLVRLQAHADVWREAGLLDDDALAHRIADDRIDILVSLLGLGPTDRVQTLLRRPAPVQIGYLGNPSISALPALDYRITDNCLDPPDESAWDLSEMPLRAPAGLLCYRPEPDAPALAPSPARRRGFVTFGCFSPLAKWSPAAITSWGELLASCPSARLRCEARGLGDSGVWEWATKQLIHYGVDCHRVKLVAAGEPPSARLASYADIDILLDTFPYSDARSVCEALWMGVPVVTCSGQTQVSRLGHSTLARVGLSEWVAFAAQDYVRIARQLARDPAALTALRTTLRSTVQRSPLRDEAGFTRSLETLYRQVAARRA